MKILLLIQEYIYFRRLKSLKKKADERKLLTKMPHYVIRWNRRLQVKSSKWFKAMRKSNRLTKSFNWYKLQEMAVYKTN